MTQPLIQLRALTRRFETGGGWFTPARSMTAVRAVDLAIARGEVVGVVGESGCGKSTLARLVLRLIEPTSGQILLDGTDLTALPRVALRAARRRMAMVFQDPYSSLDPRYTVADVLAEPFVVQRRPMDKGAAEAMLADVGLPASVAASHPHQLSAASVSAWASPAPLPCAPISSCWMNRPPRSTCRFRRRSSSCCLACVTGWG